MRLLILGGSWFLGRAIVEEAMVDGWSVTAFNRGRSSAPLPGVEIVHGDRANAKDFVRLAERGPWDAVIDTIGWVPNQVLAAATALAPAVDHYLYVSTVNAYLGWPNIPIDEDSPLFDCPPDAGEDFRKELGEAGHYGTQKAGCERAARQALGDSRVTALRPGVILGPREYVGRLTSWLTRAARGGELLAPGPSTRSIQPVDVRDVAAFALRCGRERIAGDYNVTAPIGSATFADLVDACVEVTGAGSRPVWVDPAWLTRQGVRQWTEVPLWRTTDGVWQVSSSRAQEAGLRCRPLPVTVADTWSWMTRGGTAVREEAGEAARAAEHGLDPGQEAVLLQRWQEA
jgi:nucleoside-diphosphate-sugar epimerase